MASWQKEVGTTKGRGFGSVDGVPSFMNRFKTWIVKNAVSGGPAWFIVDDQSALADNPYIVVSDKSTLSNANRNKIFKVWIPTNPNTADRVYFAHYIAWNTSTHAGVGLIDEKAIITQESSEYAYDFRGGPEGLLIMARIGTTWSWVMLMEWTGVTAVLEDESGHTGTLTQTYPLEANDNNNQISGFTGLTGIGGANVDANGKIYVNVTVSGANIGCNIYKDSARTQLIAHVPSANYTLANAITVTVDNSSGVGGTIQFDAKVANDSDIEVDFSLNFGTGEGAGFTPGKSYFIWDFYSNFSQRINAVKVYSVSGDKVIPDTAQMTGSTFTPGAVMSPYGHRWYLQGSNAGSGSAGNSAQIPYMSWDTNNAQQGINALCNGYNGNSQASFTYNSVAITVVNPDDEGRYGVSKALVFEARDKAGVSYQNASTGNKPNRVYGLTKNFYVTSGLGLSTMLDGRVIGTDNYLAFFVPSDAYLIKDTTSLS